jgi:hypothetical protein
MELSLVGHREETMFSYDITLNGGRCLLTPDTVIYHLKQATGGIRSWTPEEMKKHYEKDNAIFTEYCNTNNITFKKTKVINALFGFGDCVMLRQRFPEIIKPDVHYYICTQHIAAWNEIEKEYPNVTLVHPNLGVGICGSKGIDFNRLNPYNYICSKYTDNYKEFQKEHKHFSDAFLEIYNG